MSPPAQQNIIYHKFLHYVLPSLQALTFPFFYKYWFCFITNYFALKDLWVLVLLTSYRQFSIIMTHVVHKKILYLCKESNSWFPSCQTSNLITNTTEPPSCWIMPWNPAHPFFWLLHVSQHLIPILCPWPQAIFHYYLSPMTKQEQCKNSLETHQTQPERGPRICKGTLTCWDAAWEG